MALPKINQPLFEIEIPSTGRKVKYRPFTVKEEKILLFAQESKDLDQIILAISQIVTNCLQDVSDSILDKLAIFDLEYLLINLRAKSVSDEIDFNIKDPDTEEVVELSLDLSDIEIKNNDDHKKVIPVNEDISIVMSYPKLNQLRALSNIGDAGEYSAIEEMEEKLKTSELSKKENADLNKELAEMKRAYRLKTDQALFDTMIDCIESVVEGENVYNLAEFSKQEIDDFVESLSSKDVESIKKFFDTMPKLRYEKKYKLEDGSEKTFVAEGTETFFI